MTTCQGKSCSFGLLRMSFVNVYQFLCVSVFGLNFIYSYNKQYEHSIYITDISINIIQKGSRRKSTDLFESVSLYLQ